MRSRSLRTRLVAITLLLLAAASAVVALVTTLTLRGFLLRQLDDQLRAAAQVAPLFEPPPGPPGPLPVGGPGPGPQEVLFARAVDGRVVEAVVLTGFGATRPVPAAEYADLAAVRVGDPSRSLDLGELGGYRVLATPAPGGVVVTGLAEAQVAAFVGRLVATELGVTAVALVGAGLVGAVVVRRELRPLERVAATASRVSALRLDRGDVELAERVPDADPRTEVGQVGAALNRMLDHVGSALEARHDSEVRLRRFVADASHELRTPLAAIRGYAELSRRGELAADTAHALERISSQAVRMSALVEDLLLLARLDAGPAGGRVLERTEVDLTRLVVDAVGDAHAAGPEHRWGLELPDEPVAVPGDPMRLAQVLANLLANARTHTPPGTPVTVTLAREADAVRLSVEDTGPGIAPDLLPRVFERFTRGSASRSRASGSTGLGLSIVDAVVAAHGGSVGVTSRPGHTAFTVRLPTAG